MPAINFEGNLDSVQTFLLEAALPQTFNALRDKLTETVTPKLERFSTGADRS